MLIDKLTHSWRFWEKVSSSLFWHTYYLEAMYTIESCLYACFLDKYPLIHFWIIVTSLILWSSINFGTSLFHLDPFQLLWITKAAFSRLRISSLYLFFSRNPLNVRILVLPAEPLDDDCLDVKSTMPVEWSHSTHCLWILNRCTFLSRIDC